MDISEIIEDYATWHEISGHSPKTISVYRWALGALRTWLINNEKPTDIDAITVADVRSFLLSEQQRDELYVEHPHSRRRPGKLSDRSIHIYVRCIRAFFKWLVDEEYLRKNPMERLKPPKLEVRYKEVVSATDIEKLLGGLNQRTFLGSRMYAIITLLFDSGLRASELTGIDLGDVDWGGYQVKVKGKGSRERLVPFSLATKRALRKYLILRETFEVEREEALFINAEGSRLTASALNQAIKRLGVNTGIPRLHPHLLRHSSAVAAVMNGADQFALKRILGHSQLSTTDQYVDYTQQHLAERHRSFSPMSKVNERKAASKPKKRRGS